MGFERAQTVFNSGALDPRLRARFDLERYRNAVAEATDVLLTPQGSFKRRPGTVLDDDADGTPTWILPFKMTGLTVLKNPSTPVGTETFNWTGATVGTDVVSDAEIAFDQTYEITHVFATNVSVNSDRSADFDVRFEFWDSARTTWVPTPYLKVHFEAAEDQDGAGGNLVYLSDDSSEFMRVGGFTKMRAKIKNIPDTSVTLSVGFAFRSFETSQTLEVSNVRYGEFNVSETEQFIVAFTDQCVTVFEKETDSSTGERYLTVRASITAPWTNDQINDIDWVQRFDTMILVHEDVEPRMLIREGETEFWSLRTVTFKSDFVQDPQAIHIPQDPVDDINADNAGQPGKWRIEFITFTNGDEYQLIVNGQLAEPTAFATTAATNVTRLEAALAAITNILSGTFSVTNVSGHVYEISYSFTDLSFVPALDSVESLVNTGAGFLAAWKVDEGVPYSNDKWSSAAGWPRSVTIYQERLWFGGARSFPDEIYGSRVGDLFSFWNDENLDAEAITAKLESDELQNIRAIHPGRNLQIFTDQREFYVPQGATTPLTPNNFQVNSATNRGIKKGVKPTQVTGATLFLRRNNDSVREFLFVDTEQDYDAQDVSLLSSHLLKTTLSMKRWRSTEGQEFDLVLLPQGSSGNMAVFGTLRDQGIGGWFDWTLDVRDVAVTEDTLYGCVQDTILSDTVNMMVRYDNDAFADLLTADPALAQSASDGVITGLYAHKGQTVVVRVDENFIGEFTLDGNESTYTGSGNPQLDTDEIIDSSYQVGRRFTPRVKQLPTAIQTEGGLIWTDRKKRIRKGVIDVIDTYAVNVATLDDESNAERIAAEVAISTSAPALTNGRVRFGGRRGWDDKANLTITQPLPYPMHILAVQTWVDL